MTSADETRKVRKASPTLAQWTKLISPREVRELDLAAFVIQGANFLDLTLRATFSHYQNLRRGIQGAGINPDAALVAGAAEVDGFQFGRVATSSMGVWGTETAGPYGPRVIRGVPGEASATALLGAEGSLWSCRE